MHNGNINIGGTGQNALNAQSLAGNTLILSDNGQATLTSNTQIGDLEFTGGTLVIGKDHSIAHQLDVNQLNAAGGGKIAVDFSGSIDTSISTDDNWYDYAVGSLANQHLVVKANNIIDSGQVEWVGMTDNGAQMTSDIIDSSGKIGEATFNYIASTVTDSANSNNGLSLGYTLTQLKAEQDKTLMLDSTHSIAENGAFITAKLTGAGNVSFSGSKASTIGNIASDYTGDTVVDGTTLTIASNNAFGQTHALNLVNGAIINMNDKTQTVGNLISSDNTTRIVLGELTVNQVSSDENSVFAGQLTGGNSSKLIKDGEGRLTLSNTNNDFGGGTKINGGTLIASNEGVVGTGEIRIESNGTLELNYVGIMANKLNGTGSLNTNIGDNNTLSLNNNNVDFNGDINVISGTLTTNANSALGTMSNIVITDGATLNLSHSDNITSTFTGLGRIDVNADIFYTGISKEFTGLTTVNQGNSLYLKNDDNNIMTELSGTMNISGGKLAGNGQFNGNVNVINNGVISAGNSIGHLSINGDMTLDNTAYFDVEVNPNDSTKSDLVTVTGTATLNDAILRHNGLGEEADYSYEGTNWTILTAGSILGKFSGIESKFAMLDSTLTYSATDVILSLQRTNHFDSFAHTYNQNSVSYGLDSLNPSNPIYVAMVNLVGDENDVRNAYDSLSGEIHAGLPGALMNRDRHFANQMLDRLSNGLFKTQLVNEVKSKELDSEHYFWLTGDGFRSETGKTHDNAKAVLQGHGIQMGGEIERDSLILGGTFGYGNADYKVDSLQSKADIQSFKFGGYGAFQNAEWRYKAGLSYGWHQVNTTRSVNVGALHERINADYDIHTIQLFNEVARSIKFNTNPTIVEPYVGLGWNLSHNENFKEKGGKTALNAKAVNNDNLSSTIGSRFYFEPSDNIKLAADINWQHIYGSLNSKSRFTLDNSERYTIQGAPFDRNSFGVKLETGIQITPVVNLKVGYQGQFGHHSRYNGGFANMDIRF